MAAKAIQTLRLELSIGHRLRQWREAAAQLHKGHRRQNQATDQHHDTNDHQPLRRAPSRGPSGQGDVQSNQHKLAE